MPSTNRAGQTRCHSRTGQPEGYPQRQPVPDWAALWNAPFPGYDPPEYTASVVLAHEGDWADPNDVRRVQRPFLTATADGEIPAELDEQGRPRNPLGRTGIQGRGRLGRWGRNLAGDALLISDNPHTGRWQLLVIERKDTGQIALPGGMAEATENPALTVSRELREETGVVLDFDGAVVLYRGMVDDPRNTDHAWIETTVLFRHLSADERDSSTLQAGDDAGHTYWADIDDDLLSKMYASHGDYVQLAVVSLKGESRGH